MGENVGATPDGRLSGTPLADEGLSPMAGGYTAYFIELTETLQNEIIERTEHGE
jgi:pyruvate-formate lyase